MEVKQWSMARFKDPTSGEITKKWYFDYRVSPPLSKSILFETPEHINQFRDLLGEAGYEQVEMD